MPAPKFIAVLPTLLTLGNAVCGFGAITFAAKLGPIGAEGPTPDTIPFICALLVFAAMLFDMLDGSAARLTRQTSELGAQLDSLCDGVSFGVAPAFLMLQFVNSPQLAERGLNWHPRLLWTIAVLYALCALLRLARFNVETDDEDSHDEFSGLPSPAAAGTVVAFPFAMSELLGWSKNGTPFERSVADWLIPTVRTILPLITLAVAMLMVSRIRYAHVFNQFLRGPKTRRHVIQLVFAAAVIFWTHEVAAPLIFCWFALMPPLTSAWREMTTRYWSRRAEQT
ncbi:MAG TPA: phosphatidylcholine/phosphatidylserine synthase [Caulifigura sp.]|jgi:CDP-diacylglycerol--serine O-phosphatidyltransferase|nr:phosphatidylcholine/phosphatidylserine synthase [Caulifigura sp.]